MIVHITDWNMFHDPIVNYDQAGWLWLWSYTVQVAKMSSGAGESELLEIYYSPNSATKESWSFKHPNIIGNFFCQKNNINT